MVELGLWRVNVMTGSFPISSRHRHPRDSGDPFWAGTWPPLPRGRLRRDRYPWLTVARPYTTEATPPVTRYRMLARLTGRTKSVTRLGSDTAQSRSGGRL